MQAAGKIENPQYHKKWLNMGKNRKKGQNPEKIWSDWILLDKREPETPTVLTTLF